MRADQAQCASEGYVVYVMSGHLGVGAVLTVSGDRAVHRPGIDGADFFVPGAQPVHDAGPEPLDHHIGRLGQLVEDLLGFGFLQVQGEAALVALQSVKCRVPAFVFRTIDAGDQLLVGGAGLIHGPFNHQHIRSQVGQNRRGEHARCVAAEIQYLDPFERLHMPLYLVF